MTTSEPAARPPEDRGAATADTSWMLWTAVGIGGIWVNVLLTSLFAPALVSGSEQQRLPVAAFTTWLWGVLATMVLLWAMSRLRRNARSRPNWIGLSVVTVLLWSICMVLAITLPVFETGTDPTRIPIGALVAPVAASMLTMLAAVVTTAFRHRLPHSA